MKKQTNILTQTQPGRKQWMLIATIVAMVYRNQSNRSVPAGSLPLNATREMLMNLVTDAEKLVSKLAGLFYNVTGESFISLFNFFAFAGLIISIALAVVMNRAK